MSDSPQLSEKSSELLLAAVRTSNAEIWRDHVPELGSVPGGLRLKVNGKSFIEPGNAHSEAEWEAALEELVANGLVEPRQDTKFYRVTDPGFRVADTLGSDTEGY